VQTVKENLLLMLLFPYHASNHRFLLVLIVSLFCSSESFLFFPYHRFRNLCCGTQTCSLETGQRFVGIIVFAGKRERGRQIISFSLHSFRDLCCGTETCSGETGQRGAVSIVVFAARHIFGSIADEGDIVEDGTLWASNFTWVSAFVADVEESAVVFLQVTGVVELLSVGVDLGGVGAGESGIENINADAAAGTETRVFPLAGAGELIEDETGGAGAEDSETASAFIVLLAV